MGTTVLGWILIVVGLIATIAGIGGGIATMFKEIKRKAEEGGYAAVPLPTELIEALIKFMEALGKQPIWLALTIIGLALIAWGGTMI